MQGAWFSISSISTIMLLRGDEEFQHHYSSTGCRIKATKGANYIGHYNYKEKENLKLWRTLYMATIYSAIYRRHTELGSNLLRGVTTNRESRNESYHEILIHYEIDNGNMYRTNLFEDCFHLFFELICSLFSSMLTQYVITRHWWAQLTL